MYCNSFGPRLLANALSDALKGATQRVPGSSNAVLSPSPQPRILAREPLRQNAPTGLSSPPTTPAPTTSLPLLTRSKTQSESRHHILVVDDNAINVKILTKLLGGLGCSYTTAINGLEAVQAYKVAVEPFSIVFMDVSMPVMNGFDATRNIRLYEREAGLKPVKVVALTGLGDEGSEKEASACGMDDFWVKPVALGRVKTLLAREIDLHAASGNG